VTEGEERIRMLLDSLVWMGKPTAEIAAAAGVSLAVARRVRAELHRERPRDRDLRSSREQLFREVLADPGAWPVRTGPGRQNGSSLERLAHAAGVGFVFAKEIVAKITAEKAAAPQTVEEILRLLPAIHGPDLIRLHDEFAAELQRRGMLDGGTKRV
jgi:hypothetical protein